jgi:aminoglycoside 3-N-acetyltransferase
MCRTELMRDLSDLKGHTKRLLTKAERMLHRLRTPIRPDEMRSTVDRLTGGGREILFVHASLSSCGRFTMGPVDVLRGLGEFCDTLAFPTHTYCYPTSADEPGAVFNPATTPSQNGLLTEIFRTQVGSMRSVHATHSLAASGKVARQICSDHYQRNTPCGAETPYNQLVQRRAAVLLFGVTFHSYTLFHTAEDASGSEFAYEYATVDRLRVVDEEGQQQECLSRRQSRAPRRFTEAGRLLESYGLVYRVTLGRGNLLFVPDCSRVHDFLVERLKRIPDFLHESCARTLQ